MLQTWWGKQNYQVTNVGIEKTKLSHLLFNILLILYRVFRSCLPAASSASLSTNFLLSNVVIFFHLAVLNSEYFLLSWSHMRSDWVEFIGCLTFLLVSFFSQVSPCIHSSFFLFLNPRTFSPAALNNWLKELMVISCSSTRIWKWFFSSHLKACLIRSSL